MDYADVVTGGRGYMIAEMPEVERPRERLQHLGAAALRTEELLAILLRTGTRNRSALELAEDLLRRFDGDLMRLATAPLVELEAVRGIGPAKAVEIRAVFDLARRVQAATRPERGLMATPDRVADLMRDEFHGREQEEFYILLLDVKNRLVHRERVTIGLLDRSLVHAREVFRTAIREGSSRIVLCHNHPSGDPTPSNYDLECTRNLQAAGKIVGIDILDHVIVGSRTLTRTKDYHSFRENALL